MLFYNNKMNTCSIAISVYYVRVVYIGVFTVNLTTTLICNDKSPLFLPFIWQHSLLICLIYEIATGGGASGSPPP